MNIGLEKENLLFTKDYKPANNTLDNLNGKVSLDFSANHLEFITKVYTNEFEVIKELNALMNEDFVLQNVVWPISMPAINDYEPKIDVFGDERNKYRLTLLNKYGKEKLNLAGIHYNFDFNDESSEEHYFEIMKKVYEYIPILVQFTAFSPMLQNVDLPQSISLRNSSHYGYMNYDKYKLDFSNYNAYVSSIEDAINKGVIQSENEVYTPVRLKKKKRVYLELRFFDLNPYTRVGIDVDTLILMKNFLKVINNMTFSCLDPSNALQNFETVTISGRDKNIKLKVNGSHKTLKEHTIELFSEVLKQNLPDHEKYIVEKFLQKYLNDKLDINKMIDEIKEEKLSVIEFGKKHSYVKESYDINIKSEMELSTKILIEQAKKEKVDFEVLNERFNLVEFKFANKSEIVMQATKTNLDGFATVSILENKYLTKQALAKKQIKTPEGFLLTKKSYLNDEYDMNFLRSSKIVIKPLDTNFGKGITILNANSDIRKIKKAISFAFNYSDVILCEKYFKGQEYRFLVIDEEVVSIVKRDAANVIGDGVRTISELIDQKNKSPLRSQGYKTPLEQIKKTTLEKDFLQEANLSFESIPFVGQKVYLRENSNVSTGGDSEEVYSMHSEYFKDIAICATRQIGAKICGIDMIIDEKYADYRIIEANYNPAIQMHTYPYLGIGKNVAAKILNLLRK